MIGVSLWWPSGGARNCCFQAISYGWHGLLSVFSVNYGLKTPLYGEEASELIEMIIWVYDWDTKKSSQSCFLYLRQKTQDCISVHISPSSQLVPQVDLELLHQPNDRKKHQVPPKITYLLNKNEKNPPQKVLKIET